MPNYACQAVRSWSQRQESSAYAGLLAPNLVDHAATCATCSAVLATVAGTVLGRSAPPAPIACVDCEHDLDAYIDWEERSGSAAAARRYPQLWWHLLTCSECAEVYAGVHALLGAEATGDLALPLPQLYPVFQLARSYLHAALAPQLELGAGWGADDAQVIASEQIGCYQLALSAYPTTETTVTLLVQVTPPVPGAIEVRLDPLFVRAPFAANGTAYVNDIPATVVAAVTADDLRVDLELDDPID
jgi:hypothetical protein